MDRAPGLTTRWKLALYEAPHWVKMLLGTLAAAFALLAIIDGALPARGDEVLARTLVGGVSALLLLVYLILTVMIPDDRPWHTASRRIKAIDDNDAWIVEGPDLVELKRIVDNPRPEDARRVKGYAHLLLGLAARMYHCGETYEIQENRRIRTIDADYRLLNHMLSKLTQLKGYDDAEASICFPIMTMGKGALPNDLHISVEGKRLPITPYDEVQRLQVLTLWSLFTGTFGSKPPPELFDRALQAVSWVGSPSAQYGERGKQARKHRENVTKLLSDLEEHWQSVPRSKTLQDPVHLRKFITVYSDAYPVCFELPHESLREIVSVRIVMGMPGIDVVDGFTDRVRAWLEIDNFKFRMPLTRMFMSKSYHLSFVGNATQYLFSQFLEEYDRDSTGELVSKHVPLATLRNASTTGQSHVRLESWNQLPRSHFYARGFRSVDMRPLFAVVRLHERPPGPLGTAAAMLGLNAILIAIFGFFATARNFPASLNLSAFLLALPAISLHFSGSSKSGDPAAYMSLKARFGRLVAMWISLLAVVLYALEQTNLFVPGIVGVGVLGFRLPYDDAWLALLTIASGFAIYLAGSVVFRTWHYRSRLARGSGIDDSEIIAARIDLEEDIESVVSEIVKDQEHLAQSGTAQSSSVEKGN